MRPLFKTLAELRESLAVSLGFGAMAGVIDLQIPILNQFLQQAQQQNHADRFGYCGGNFLAAGEENAVAGFCKQFVGGHFQAAAFSSQKKNLARNIAAAVNGPAAFYHRLGRMKNRRCRKSQ